jgi:hypothetical protein
VNQNHDQLSHSSRIRSRWGRRRRPTPNHNPTRQPPSVPAPEQASPADEGWTLQRVSALGVVTDVPTAGQILGLSRTTAYTLARAGRFPVPVLRVGRLYRVSVNDLLRVLNLPTDPPDGRLERPPARSVDGSNTTGATTVEEHHDA